MTTQARALETRRAILAAAADVFLKRGFAGTSLSEIATLAGVTKGALYFHFASKAELAKAMILSQREVNESFILYVNSFDGSRLELLRRMTYGLADQLINEPTLQAAMRLAVEHPDAGGEHTVSTYADWEEMVARVAEAGQSRGEVTTDLSARHIARLLVGAFTGFQTVSAVSTSLTDLTERLDDLWLLLYDALRPGDSGAKR